MSLKAKQVRVGLIQFFLLKFSKPTDMFQDNAMAFRNHATYGQNDSAWQSGNPMEP